MTVLYSGWMPCFMMSVPGLRKGRDYTEKSTPSHRVEEFRVLLGGFQLVDQEFGRLELVHRVEQLAQDPDLLQERRLDQELLAAGGGGGHVGRGGDGLFVPPAVRGGL